MNVSLTPKLEAFVRRKVASGLYNNASEVVREALRLMLEREGEGAGPPKHEIRARLADMEPTLRRRGLTSLSLFGSVARGEAGAGSDIDLLVDIDPKARFSLVDLAAVKRLVEERLGRSVDVVPRNGLPPGIRRTVLAEAERVF
jgi:putative addiction module CopG family antidote